MNARYRLTSDLPETIPVFPLSGVLLLPRGQLPLNVFEPRYLAMVDSVMAGARVIGMIQPSESEEKALKPALSAIGCVGRVTSYRESEDGRYLITLTGLCRFRIAEELDGGMPFREVRADYAPFETDLVAAEEEGDFPRDRLMAALKTYLARRDLKADWQSVTNAPAEQLITALSMLCPFEPAEKQALLEARDWGERAAILIALLEMAGAAAAGPATIN